MLPTDMRLELNEFFMLVNSTAAPLTPVLHRQPPQSINRLSNRECRSVFCSLRKIMQNK